MTEAQAIEAIDQAWITGWTALRPTIPFTLDNEAALALAQWASVEIHHQSRTQTSAGSAPSRRFEVRGVIVVTLYAPVDQGRSTVAGMADDVRSILESRQIGSVTDPVNTYGSATAELGDDGTRNCRSTVTVPFWYAQHR